MSDVEGQSPVTMRDVAKAAGVSQPTVSRALRNDPRVRTSTRQRIRQLAEEMGYSPNPLVSALMSQVTPHRHSRTRVSIGVLDCWPRTLNSFFLTRYREGIQERAAGLGYRIEPLSFSELNGSAQRVRKVLRARGIRGLIVLPVPPETDLSGLDCDGLAVATIDFSLRSPNLHRAAPNYFQGMQLLLSSLSQVGYRRVGYCSLETEDSFVASQWLGALLAWQSRHPSEECLPPHTMADAPAARQHPDYWRRSRGKFASWLRRHKPDVVVSNAFFFLGWIQQLGREVPADVAFASLGIVSNLPSLPEFTNLPIDPCSASITGIDQRQEKVGSAAVDLVVGQFNRNDYGLPNPEKTVLIEGRWVNGETTNTTAVPLESTRNTPRRASNVPGSSDHFALLPRIGAERSNVSAGHR